MPSNPPAHSESGLLGKLVFRRPGLATPLASSQAKIGQQVLALDHQVTAAELATPGDWTCQVFNSTESTVTFQTDVVYPSNIVLQTASFDIPLLNIILTNLSNAALVRVHLQSSSSVSGGKDSSVTWSQAFSPVFGQTQYFFHVDDAHGGDVRIENLNSGPASVTLRPADLVFELDLSFDTTVGKMVGLNWTTPDIDLQFFTISITLDTLGVITPHCSTKAIASFLNTDVSGDVEQGVVSALGEMIAAVPQLSKPSLKKSIDTFFARLLRLGDAAQINKYAIAGNSMVVSYFVAVSATNQGGSSAGAGSLAASGS